MPMYQNAVSPLPALRRLSSPAVPCASTCVSSADDHIRTRSFAQPVTSCHLPLSPQSPGRSGRTLAQARSATLPRWPAIVRTQNCPPRSHTFVRPSAPPGGQRKTRPVTKPRSPSRWNSPVLAITSSRMTAPLPQDLARRSVPPSPSKVAANTGEAPWPFRTRGSRHASPALPPPGSSRRPLSVTKCARPSPGVGAAVGGTAPGQYPWPELGHAHDHLDAALPVLVSVAVARGHFRADNVARVPRPSGSHAAAWRLLTPQSQRGRAAVVPEYLGPPNNCIARHNNFHKLIN